MWANLNYLLILADHNRRLIESSRAWGICGAMIHYCAVIFWNLSAVTKFATELTVSANIAREWMALNPRDGHCVPANIPSAQKHLRHIAAVCRCLLCIIPFLDPSGTRYQLRCWLMLTFASYLQNQASLVLVDLQHMNDITLWDIQFRLRGSYLTCP